MGVTQSLMILRIKEDDPFSGSLEVIEFDKKVFASDHFKKKVKGGASFADGFVHLPKSEKPERDFEIELQGTIAIIKNQWICKAELFPEGDEKSLICAILPDGYKVVENLGTKEHDVFERFGRQAITWWASDSVTIQFVFEKIPDR